jgi:hypothetical protein
LISFAIYDCYFLRFGEIQNHHQHQMIKKTKPSGSIFDTLGATQTPAEKANEPVKTEEKTLTNAPVAEEDDAQTQLTPYRFSVTVEKGKKALVRFRENLRKLYSACNLNDALWMRDNPVLEVYCYDPETGIGYCRLTSNKHDGPLFESPKQLYETYNCSSQGHPNDVFIYNCEGDEDHGMELSKFLREIEILRPNQFPEEYQKFFQDSVKNNVLLAAYPAALEEKRSVKKSSEDDDSQPKSKSATPEAESDTKAKDQEETKKRTASTTHRKKRTKDREVEGSAAARTKKSKTKKDDPAETSLQLFPMTLKSLELDEEILDNTTAVFSYQSQNLRLGDLPPDSIERASICWNIFSHLLSTRTTPLKLSPDVSPNDILRLAATE